MATFNKFDQFVEDLAHKVHDLETDQIVVALCAAANAPVAGNTVLANLTEASYTYLSTRNVTTSSSGQTGGVYTAAFADLILTASGGSVGPFRYIVLFNTTSTTPAAPLIGWYDYGSDLTLNSGEQLTIDFAASSLTIT